MALFPWNNPANPWTNPLLKQTQPSTQPTPQEPKPWNIPEITPTSATEQVEDAPFGYSQPLLAPNAPQEVKDRNPAAEVPGIGFEQGGSWMPESWRQQPNMFLPEWIQQGQNPTYPNPQSQGIQPAPGTPQPAGTNPVFQLEMQRKKQQEYLSQLNNYSAAYSKAVAEYQKWIQDTFSKYTTPPTLSPPPTSVPPGTTPPPSTIPPGTPQAGSPPSPNQLGEVARVFHTMAMRPDSVQLRNIQGIEAYAFTLRPGDVLSWDRGNIGPSGLPNQRAEIGYAPPQNTQKMNSPYSATAATGPKSYNINVMFDQNFPTNHRWATLFQFHPGNPPLNDWSFPGVSVHGNEITFKEPWTAKVLAKIPIQRGAWYDIKMDVNWSAGSDGYVKVFVNGNQVMNYTGRTALPGAFYYLQQGYYRDGGTTQTGTVYQTPVRIS